MNCEIHLETGTNAAGKQGLAVFGNHCRACHAVLIVDLNCIGIGSRLRAFSYVKNIIVVINIPRSIVFRRDKICRDLAVVSGLFHSTHGNFSGKECSHLRTGCDIPVLPRSCLEILSVESCRFLVKNHLLCHSELALYSNVKICVFHIITSFSAAVFFVPPAAESGFDLCSATYRRMTFALKTISMYALGGGRYTSIRFLHCLKHLNCPCLRLFWHI